MRPGLEHEPHPREAAKPAAQPLRGRRHPSLVDHPAAEVQHADVGVAVAHVQAPCHRRLDHSILCHRADLRFVGLEPVLSTEDSEDMEYLADGGRLSHSNLHKSRAVGGGGRRPRHTRGRSGGTAAPKHRRYRRCCACRAPARVRVLAPPPTSRHLCRASLTGRHSANPMPSPSDDTRSRKNSPYGAGPVYALSSTLQRHPDSGRALGSPSSSPVTALHPTSQRRSSKDLASTAATRRPAASRPTRTSTRGGRYSKPPCSTPGLRSAGECVKVYSPPP